MASRSLPLLVSVALLAVAAAAGCDRRTDAPAPSPAAAPSSVGPVAETDSFRAELKPAAAYKKGEPASYEIIVRAKDPFHVNDEYPAKFKANDSAGVQYAEPKLERMKHGASFSTEPCAVGTGDCTLKVIVKFTPEQSGRVNVGGTIDVSVCNKDQCVIEKKQVSVGVDVS